MVTVKEKRIGKGMGQETVGKGKGIYRAKGRGT